MSWPRSGHFLIVQVLFWYFGPRFGYCEVYEKRPTCCRSFPCEGAGIFFTKSHDFDLALPKLPDVPYLVQYRGFLPSVVSNFELWINQGNDDTSVGFRRFAMAEADRYSKFVQKWVREADCERLLLRYEDLVERPEANLRKAIQFFEPDDPINSDTLRQVIRTVDGHSVTRDGVQVIPQFGIKETRRVEEFRFYDTVLFEDLRCRSERD